MTIDLNLGDTKLIAMTCLEQGLLRNQAAYVLATAYWETARTMEPVRETLAETDQSAIRRLDHAWANGQLTWVSRPYWREGWFGRGYVQLTHERNYVKAGQHLGINLVADPAKAMQPDIAAAILVIGCRDGWFTGKRLSDYLTREASNYRGARRVVNGTDKAAAIAEIARDYEAALLAEGYGVEPPAPVIEDRRDGTPPRTQKRESKTLRAVVRDWMGTLGLTGGGVLAWWSEQSPEAQQAIYIAAGLILAGILISGHAKLDIWRERARKLLTGEDV